MTSKYIRAAIRFGVFLLFVFVLFHLIEMERLKEAMQRVRLDVIGLAVMLYFVNIGIRAYRLEKIFNKTRNELSFKDAYILTLIGIALNIIVPATFGDIAKSYYGYKLYGFKEEILSASLVDKLFAFCSLFSIGAVSGWMLGYTLLAAVSLGMAILAFLVITFPRVVPWHGVNMMLRVFHIKFDPTRLLNASSLPHTLSAWMFGVSIVGWIGTCVYFYVVCLAFPATVHLGYILAIMPVLTIVRLFPFTVNSLGPMEVTVAYFFSMIGIHPTLSVLISLTSNIISSIIPGIVGVFFMLWKRKS